MIRVAALTSGKKIPSTRFRIRQFVAPLRSYGIRVVEHRPFVDKYAFPRVRALGRLWTIAKLLSRVPGVLASRRSDVVWIERELLAGRFTLERFVSRQSVLDVDDAIWLTGKPGYSERIAQHCRGVIAGNAFIAEHYRGAAERVWIVPTSVDTDRWQPRPRAGGRRWTIGWIGTGGNLDYLCAIEDQLRCFLAEHSDARLLVVSDREPAFEKLPAGVWRFERWSEDREVALVTSMDVGLMPLPDTEWARGKCGAKMLLYMAAGLPVLVSPMGSNAEILSLGRVGLGPKTPEEWFEGLRTLYSDRDLAAECGAAGRRIAVQSYSVQANAARLARIFEEVAE
jgi:glycosyltransferase involved in cell wall biosynthesis